MRRIVVLFCLIVVYQMSFSQSNNHLADKVKELYSLYDEHLTARKSQRYSDDANGTKIKELYDSFNQSEKEVINRLIAKDVLYSFENDDKLTFLERAERALNIIPSDCSYSFDILSLLGDVYLEEENPEKVYDIVDLMRTHPESKTGENSSIIDSLEYKAMGIKPFTESLNGVWVADSLDTIVNKNNQPWLILEVFDTDRTKVASISEQSVMQYRGFFNKPSSRESQFFETNKNNGTFLFEFNSSKVHQGNVVLSNALVETSQDARARAKANMNQSKNFGEMLVHLFAGYGTSIGFLLLGNKVAISNMQEVNIELYGSKRGANMIDARLLGQYQFVDNSASAKIQNDTIVNLPLSFYRWVREDNVIFSDKRCRPISPYVQELYPDMELYQLKKETRFTQSKYLIPTLAGFVLSTGLYALGVKTVVEESDSTSGDISNRFKTGIMISSIGAAGMYASIIIPLVKCSKHRKIRVRDYNQLQLERIKQNNRVQ